MPLTLCFFGALLLFGLEPWLIQRYVSSAPHSPNPATGQVIEFNQHGYVVFFSRRQELTLSSITFSGILFFGAAAIVLSGRSLVRDSQ